MRSRDFLIAELVKLDTGEDWELELYKTEVLQAWYEGLTREPDEVKEVDGKKVEWFYFPGGQCCNREYIRSEIKMNIHITHEVVAKLIWQQ